MLLLCSVVIRALFKTKNNGTDCKSVLLLNIKIYVFKYIFKYVYYLASE